MTGMRAGTVSEAAMIGEGGTTLLATEFDNGVSISTTGMLLLVLKDVSWKLFHATMVWSSGESRIGFVFSLSKGICEAERPSNSAMHVVSQCAQSPRHENCKLRTYSSP